MAKKVTLNISKTMADKIPYKRCYEELGIIEIEKNIFTRGYQIENSKEQIQTSFHIQLVRSCMETILKDIALKGFSYQFCVRNRRLDPQKYLKDIFVTEQGEEKLDKYIGAYNKTVRENISVGHNNFETKVYYIVSVVTEIVEDAIDQFNSIDETIKNNFSMLYGYIARPMNLMERLETLFDIYHPENKETFGTIVDYDGMGFSFHSMQLMKLKTKDIIAPNHYIDTERDYIKVGSMYARGLFINSIPENVADTVLIDIMGVSSNSVLSILYLPMDSEVGLSASAHAVKNNVYTKTVPICDTVEDRKSKKTEIREYLIKETEQTYFEKTALELFKDSVAKGNPTILTSFVIVLFADDLEELKRDTHLLKLSASKYAIQIRTADNLQNESFQTALPLNHAKIDIKRTFSIDRLSHMPPLNIQSLFEQVRMFQGLNAINDNLVFIDRKNNLSGMIAGIKNSGKTFTCKREIFNALATTKDEVILLTKNPKEYEHFTNELDGIICYKFHPDFADVDENFNLNEPLEELRKMVLETCITYGSGFYKKKYKNLTGDKDIFLEDEKKNIYKKVEIEAEQLKGYSNFKDMLDYAVSNFIHFEMFLSAMNNYKVYGTLPQNRLRVISLEDEMELIIQLSYFLDYAVRAKKKNKSIWLFVEGVDELLYSKTGSKFSITLLDTMEKLRIPITFVIENIVHIFANQDASMEFDYLINQMNYFKLMGLGPIERKKLVEKLNIADALIPYITDREPGEGIILTSTSNVPFTDRLGNKNNSFYKLFY